MSSALTKGTTSTNGKKLRETREGIKYQNVRHQCLRFEQERGRHGKRPNACLLPETQYCILEKKFILNLGWMLFRKGESLPILWEQGQYTY